MSLVVASWNVNSIRARKQHIIDWLQANPVDVLGVQETKVADDLFPVQEFVDIGYQVFYTGQKSYNGVALLVKSCQSAADIFKLNEYSQDEAKRFIAATVAGVQIVNVYVPNGQVVGSDQYFYKLTWLDELLSWLQAQQKTQQKILVMGDFNIAPSDLDVYNTNIWQDCILTSDLEREKIQDLLNLGFVDVFRELNANDSGFSWWDYRAGSFSKNHGLRIDLLFAYGIKAKTSWVDTTPRTWAKASDHTPVLVSLI